MYANAEPCAAIPSGRPLRHRCVFLKASSKEGHHCGRRIVVLPRLPLGSQPETLKPEDPSSSSLSAYMGKVCTLVRGLAWQAATLETMFQKRDTVRNRTQRDACVRRVWMVLVARQSHGRWPIWIVRGSRSSTRKDSCSRLPYRYVAECPSSRALHYGCVCHHNPPSLCAHGARRSCRLRRSVNTSSIPSSVRRQSSKCLRTTRTSKAKSPGPISTCLRLSCVSMVEGCIPNPYDDTMCNAFITAYLTTWSLATSHAIGNGDVERVIGRSRMTTASLQQKHLLSHI
ncbi:uncharacterized protein B0H18DRAFT_399538 [Fomitopsis serialis]|uniref:uncharacterized protein n=1 Tax=Fomitopsis serialis TaxID=139415 RepID=UPI0020075D22|nr:uncharacterized protein B0H18DRAFT_399538 [Neoantrodia serialis]KAH9924707.1 hypothetical protein B0H18DRAFT_399538 [Neoantrodia serialis]